MKPEKNASARKIPCAVALVADLRIGKWMMVAKSRGLPAGAGESFRVVCIAIVVVPVFGESGQIPKALVSCVIRIITPFINFKALITRALQH